jgi:hypothetical protein
MGFSDSGAFEGLFGLLETPFELSCEVARLAILAGDARQIDLSPRIVVVQWQATLGSLSIRTRRLVAAPNDLAPQPLERGSDLPSFATALFVFAPGFQRPIRVTAGAHDSRWGIYEEALRAHAVEEFTVMADKQTTSLESLQCGDEQQSCICVNVIGGFVDGQHLRMQP